MVARPDDGAGLRVAHLLIARAGRPVAPGELILHIAAPLVGRLDHVRAYGALDFEVVVRDCQPTPRPRRRRLVKPGGLLLCDSWSGWRTR